GGHCAAEALFENARGASCFQAGQRRSQGSDRWREKVSDFQEYLRYLVTLTAVLDPFLAVPIFLGVTSAANPAGRRRLAYIVTLTVFAVLAGSAPFGAGVLWWVLRIADAVGPKMGTTGLNIATRLLGLLLAAIAIQTMAEGLKELFPGLA